MISGIMKGSDVYCLKCKEISTFCECEETISNPDEYIVYLEGQIEIYKKLNETKNKTIEKLIKRYNKPNKKAQITYRLIKSH